MKLLLLDKDGTIVFPASGEKFVQSPDDQQLLPGVAEAIDRYANEGWTMAIASNQGGVAAGHKTLEEAFCEMQFCLKLLGGHCTWRVYFCPDFEGKTCFAGDWRGFENYSWLIAQRGYRKPNPGMIQAAMLECQITDPQSVLFVGDRPEDEQAAIAAGVPFMWADAWRNNAA